MLKKIWNDPVLSKVIATGIIGAIAYFQIRLLLVIIPICIIWYIRRRWYSSVKTQMSDEYRNNGKMELELDHGSHQPSSNSALGTVPAQVINARPTNILFGSKPYECSSCHHVFIIDTMPALTTTLTVNDWTVITCPRCGMTKRVNPWQP